MRHLWRMEVMVNIEDGNIVRIYTVQGELFCSMELPPEKGKITNEWMARRIDHLFYENDKAADRLDIIQYVIKECKREGFLPRLYFDDEQSRQNNIGVLIRQVRVERGLKAKDVAMLVGIAAANYSHIENGQTSPTYKTLVRIADVLDIRLDILPAETTPVNIEERAETAREKEREALEKQIVAQVRKEHHDLINHSANYVKKTKYYKQLVKEMEKE